MISHKHKFIFVHPNKCGGNSIEFLFQGKLDPDHRSLSEYERVYPEHYLEYFKFGFARNPWARLVSVYHGRKQGCLIPPDPRLAAYSFREALERGLVGPTQSGRCLPLLSQRWYLDSSGSFGLDFCGRVETMQQDFNVVCDHLQIPRREVPRLNSSNHKHYSTYYNNATRAFVERTYRDDIAKFGYKFESSPAP